MFYDTVIIYLSLLIGSESTSVIFFIFGDSKKSILFLYYFTKFLKLSLYNVCKKINSDLLILFKFDFFAILFCAAWSNLFIFYESFQNVFVNLW